jgi:hypothetical protein
MEMQLKIVDDYAHRWNTDQTPACRQARKKHGLTRIINLEYLPQQYSVIQYCTISCSIRENPSDPLFPCSIGRDEIHSQFRY